MMLAPRLAADAVHRAIRSMFFKNICRSDGFSARLPRATPPRRIPRPPFDIKKTAAYSGLNPRRPSADNLDSAVRARWGGNVKEWPIKILSRLHGYATSCPIHQYYQTLIFCLKTIATIQQIIKISRTHQNIFVHAPNIKWCTPLEYSRKHLSGMNSYFTIRFRHCRRHYEQQLPSFANIPKRQDQNRDWGGDILRFTEDCSNNAREW